MNEFRGPKSNGRGLSRRGFLIGAASGAFVMAFSRASVLLPSQTPASVIADSAYEPNIWFRLQQDGTIVVHIIRAEMGQHVGTALARILADELEADWSQVRIDHVDTDPKWGEMSTGGSWSVWQTFPIFSRAGAAGRMALIEEGAKLLGLPADACHARNSQVLGGGRSISYAEIVQRGDLTRSYSAEQMAQLPIKPPSERRLIGVDTDAIDIPDKTDGQAIYGIDAEIEGMVHASPKIPPTRQGSMVLSVDDSEAKKQIKGYLRSIVLEDPSNTVPGWVIVCADSTWAAMQAARLVEVKWNNDDSAGISEADLQDHATQLIADPEQGARVVADAGVEEAFASAASQLEQTYTTASVLHFQLEPVNALALQKDGRWEIHTGNQWQTLILPTLAVALGVEQTDIVMRTYLLGGGFGRRLTGDYAVPAALAAKALGRPVKLTLTREDDAHFDPFRSPSVQRVMMAFSNDGKVKAMQHDAAAGWPLLANAGPSQMPKSSDGKPFDPFAVAGADHWYNVGAHRVRCIQNDLANRVFRPGWLRSVGPGWTNFALESFMDEAAHHLQQDPVQFRLGLLDASGKNAGSAPNSVGGAARQAAVLRRLAEVCGWGAELPADTGMGIATSFGQERDMPTWVACAAQVKVDRDSGQVRVEKLWAVADAGTIVHPDGALAQMEGATYWGLSMALHEGTTFENGQIRNANLNSYTPLRMTDAVPLHIEFMPSTEVPVGLGEPGTTVVAPAIANAIFAASGARMRHLPIRPAAVLEALKKGASA